jgi:transcriptional regulator with XRE-family HTH domain
MDDAEMIRLIGENVRRARLTAGLTQRQLADDVGMRVPQLSRMETGGGLMPKVGTLKRIADRLGVKVCSLIDGDEPAPKKRKGKS